MPRLRVHAFAISVDGYREHSGNLESGLLQFWCYDPCGSVMSSRILYIPIFVAALLIHDSGLAQTAQSTQSIAARESFELAYAFVGSLSLAEEAHAKLSGLEKVETLEQLIAIRSAIIRLERASTLIRPSEKATDEMTRRSAAALAGVYDLIRSGLAEIATLTEKVQQAESKKDLDALLGPLSKVLAKLDDAWRMILDAMAAVCHTLVDNQREIDGKLAYLRITAQQRTQLLTTIKTQFPNLPATGGFATQMAARLFREWLSGPWRASDGKLNSFLLPAK